MKKMKPVAVAVTALLLSGLSFSAALAKDEPAKAVVETKSVRNDQIKIANAAKAIKEITALPKKKIPPLLLKEASAIIIVPKAPKQAFMVKGGSNGGLLLVRDKSGAWSNPVFISISGGTLGWQIVGDPMDIILLFKNGRQIDALMKGKFILDSKNKIVPGRLAATMKGASREELDAEVTTYIRSHGAFVEEGVAAGTTLQIDAAANDSFYGKQKLEIAEILSGNVARTSEDISSLQKLLTDYAAAK